MNRPRFPKRYDGPSPTGRDGPVFLLVGNPNVGKSTVFNGLTGLRQHTGNWPGKTVATASGQFLYHGARYTLLDLPGTYSLSARSPEEEIAGEAIRFMPCDGVIIVCDACSLERNLLLAFQVLQITNRVILCVNLLDEAERRGIRVDVGVLSRTLGVPCIGVTASHKKTLQPLPAVMERMVWDPPARPAVSPFCPEISAALSDVTGRLRSLCSGSSDPAEWMARVLLYGAEEQKEKIFHRLGEEHGNPKQWEQDLTLAAERLRRLHPEGSYSPEKAETLYLRRLARSAADQAVVAAKEAPDRRDRQIDRWLTGRWTGVPGMLLMLALVFWITIRGANLPSAILARLLFALGDRGKEWLCDIGCAAWFREMLMDGGYRMLAWVVSVMLPPMAIFFPLFTLLEDIGYLPRVAFNLDHSFSRCRTCGKQALTMAMGFGCNAAGVTGCRIIDSSRERLLAVLTNSFVPCNGRFPLLILMIGIFYTGRTILSALVLTAVVLIGVLMSLFATKLLSITVLKGHASSFALELPPYRRPRIGQVLVRSLLDRTVFVLGRAAAVAFPAGIFLWCLAHGAVGGESILSLLSAALQKAGLWLGLDGVILLAFLLGTPANEIVLPIALMIYSSRTALGYALPTEAVRDLLIAHGWTWKTAGSVMLFSLLHWPCSTTLLTVRRETGSWKWTGLAAVLPTLTGVALCAAFRIMTGWL